MVELISPHARSTRGECRRGTWRSRTGWPTPRQPSARTLSATQSSPSSKGRWVAHVYIYQLSHNQQTDCQINKSTNDITCGTFSTFYKYFQHHCRRCGKIFCGKCCGEKLQFHRMGFVDPVRLCTACLVPTKAEKEFFDEQLKCLFDGET